LNQLAAQVIGVLSNFAWVSVSAYVSFMIIDKTIGNRVSAQAEVEGLDIPEMGVLGYLNEDTREVQLAGEDFISTHGPGVPSKVQTKPSHKVPAGRS